MNFSDPKCSLVSPRSVTFVAGGCDASVNDCNKKASVRISFVISMPNNVYKGLLLLQLTNTVNNKINTFSIALPDGSCNCENECFVQELKKLDKLYITIILNELIEADSYLLEACFESIIQPTPTVTPTISITPTITPTISVTPTITPTISVTPTMTPTISVTPSITPSNLPITNLWAFGPNGDGRIGNNTTNSILSGNPLSIGNILYKKIALGLNHTVAVGLDNSLYVWGQNNVGQFGNGNTNASLVPFGPRKFLDAGQLEDEIGLIAAGNAFTIVTSANNSRIAVCGYNSVGQLGIIGSTTNQINFQYLNLSNITPPIRQIKTGHAYVLIIDNDGRLFHWGGLTTGVSASGPTQIGTASNWRHIAIGHVHALAVNSNGELFTWGSNYYGQLGNGNDRVTAIVTSPTRIAGNIYWKSVSAWRYGSAALTENGNLYIWGQLDMFHSAWYSTWYSTEYITVDHYIVPSPLNISTGNQPIAGPNVKAINSKYFIDNNNIMNELTITRRAVTSQTASRAISKQPYNVPVQWIYDDIGLDYVGSTSWSMLGHSDWIRPSTDNPYNLFLGLQKIN